MLAPLERTIAAALAETGQALWLEPLRVLEAALPALCPRGGTLVPLDAALGLEPRIRHSLSQHRRLDVSVALGPACD